ncbi:MAG: DUF4160 domain-containing protein [Rhodospirillales bacterium]|nr:DUF4160 domain-containing protein [Rhodospirillales bacterium]
MTTVRRFGKRRLAIFFDHNPPHFHILGPDIAVVVDLRTFEIIEGNATESELASILDWARGHAVQLWSVWHGLNG